MNAAPVSPLAQAVLVSHIGVSVADLDASVAWYEEVLDAHVLRAYEQPEFSVRIAYVALADIYFELIELTGSSALDGRGSLRGVMSTQGFNHVGFEVDACDVATERLRRRGARVVSEPADDLDLGIRSAFLADPDGNLIQIQQYI